MLEINRSRFEWFQASTRPLRNPIAAMLFRVVTRGAIRAS
jgi:hypothetical protein